MSISSVGTNSETFALSGDNGTPFTEGSRVTSSNGSFFRSLSRNMVVTDVTSGV